MAKKKKGKLTPKEKIWCAEYLIHFNGTKASIKAGYSPKTARSIGSEILAKPYIQAKIRKAMKKRMKNLNVSADRVIEELAKLAFSDIDEFYTSDGRLLQPHELPPHVSATVSSFKASSLDVGKGDESLIKSVDEYKRYSKEKALELLGRYLSMFTDKITHEGGDKPIEHKWEVTFVEPKQ